MMKKDSLVRFFGGNVCCTSSQILSLFLWGNVFFW